MLLLWAGAVLNWAVRPAGKKMGTQNQETSTAVRRLFNNLGGKIVRAEQLSNPPQSQDSKAYLLEKGAHMQGRRILDVGCGTGGTLYGLRDWRSEIVGVDLSETMLGLAKIRCKGHRVHLVQADGLCLPFSTGSFEACNCSFCFANICEPRRVIQEMTRVLRTGGLMAVTDVVAVGIREYFQVNSLERARQPENTEIMELRRFSELFAGLPLRCRNSLLTQQDIDLKSWVAASNLELDSLAFRHAKTAFRQAVRNQRKSGMPPTRRYIYSIAQFLMERTAGHY